MEVMAADVGDLVYIADERWWMGGLKSIHSVIGEPHNEDGKVYMSDEHVQKGMFVNDIKLYAEKEL
jgi:SSS family solute:Na+ symporter